MNILLPFGRAQGFISLTPPARGSELTTPAINRGRPRVVSDQAVRRAKQSKSPTVHPSRGDVVYVHLHPGE